MNDLFYWSFGLGIIANLHCVGMCGPIAMAIPISNRSNKAMFFSALIYNLGRISVYGLLGFLVGIFGLGLKFVGILQTISIVAGFVIIIYAWRKFLFGQNFNNKFVSGSIYRFSSKQMGKILKINHPIKYFFFGNLNGILPCGMVYTALITSIVAGSPINSMTTMLVFGFGTLPGMIIITLFMNKLSTQFRGKINKILPYVVSIIGLLIVLRGLNLNIPYLSPEIKFSEKTKEIKSINCHKP